MKKDKTKKTERIFLRLSPSEKKVIQELNVILNSTWQKLILRL